jgi:hypothetical protein
MSRIPRELKVFPNHCVHKVWRGHNREDNLKLPEEKQKYLDFMNEDLENKNRDCGSKFQACALMSNHTHEISLIESPVLFSNHMRRHHSRYGAFFNRTKNRCGKVAQDRPHTTLIKGEKHEIEAVCYVHANPLRAKMVKDARDYVWSTHRLYAFGIREGWMRNVVFPGWYMGLGRTMELRQREYRKIFAKYLTDKGIGPQFFLKHIFFGPSLWQEEQFGVVAAWRRARRAPS